MLPSHYRVVLEPPDERGDEKLLFVSEARRITLKGQSLREFFRSAMPLLDGRHSVAEICEATAEDFDAADLIRGLELLLAQGLLSDGAELDEPAPESWPERTPQLNLWHDLRLDPVAVQARLCERTVAVVGLSGAGAVAALALAQAGVGRLLLADGAPVGAADGYLAPTYAPAEAGLPRTEALRQRIAASVPDARVELRGESMASDEAVQAAVSGADMVLCCLDSGRMSTIYKLNRVCLALSMPWLTAATAGTEVLVGPLMRPPHTPCYLCYRMRLVAAAENPEGEYAVQAMLDRRKRDDSPNHEGLVFGEGLAGHLAALEVLKALIDWSSAAIDGQLLVLDLMTLVTTRHRVLKKPWCPACQAAAAAPAATPTAANGARPA